MNFKPDTSKRNFKPISVDKFFDLYQKNNPDTDTNEIRNNLSNFKTLKLQGQKCDCGDPIWIIGSAISGQGCFTCTTGQTDNSIDYEVK